MNHTPRSFWPPLWAGVALGLVLWLTFMITGHGLGASGFFTRLTAWFGDWWLPGATADNAYLGGMVSQGSVLSAWISWEVLGMLAGALVSALTSGRFRPAVERGRSLSSTNRLLLALAGGVLTGFGARLARGCTSGLGLSGGAALAVGGFVFLIAFFVAGFVVSYLTRRIWQ
jgi:uncharacterized membrane protein YedE/YeeE